jgi:hypothetical protein
MNGAGRWRCSLGWMSIHTATMISLIICGRLRQGIEGKRTSMFTSQHLVSDSRVCGSIFKNYLPTPMIRPSDGIIFTINYTPSWIYYKFDLIFFRYTWAFCLDLFESVMFLNNSAFSVPVVYLSFLDDMLNVPEDDYDWRKTIYSCLYFNLSRSCIKPVLYFASDVVVNTIPDRKTEVNQYHSSQLR